MLARGWIFAALIAVPSIAAAQPAPPPPPPSGSSAGPTEAAAPTDEEKRQFSEARDAYEAKKFDVALPKFQMIANLTHSPNARLYVARCLLELKRVPEAYDEMKAIANDSSGDAKYAKTREAAAQELGPLEQQVAHLQIQLAAEQKGAAVTVNGKSVPEDKLGSLTVAPGTQEVVVTQPGSPPAKQTVDVGAGQTKSVAIAPPAKPVEEHHSQGLGTLRIVGIAVAGLGVVGILTGVGTGVAAGSKFSDVQAACGTQKPCTKPTGITVADVESKIDSGKTLEKASVAMYVVGGVLVAASIPLIIVGGPKKQGDAPTATLTVSPTPGGAFIGAAGRF